MLFAVTYGRPEAGYSYSAPSAPSGSYGAPSPQYGVPSHPPVVHKHVYVHVPPPEPEYVAPRKHIHVAPAQKHYKIIFIKVKLSDSQRKLSQNIKSLFIRHLLHLHQQLQLFRYNHKMKRKR